MYFVYFFRYIKYFFSKFDVILFNVKIWRRGCDEYNSDGDEGLFLKVCDESKKIVCKNGFLED